MVLGCPKLMEPVIAQPILILGYGNSLRGDDGAGRKVAEKIAQQQWQGVLSLSLHQLTPELVENLSQARAAIFVDAIASDTGKVSIQTLKPGGMRVNFSHFTDPPALLALAQALYGNTPPAWWVLVPGINFELGEAFSAVTETAIAEAVGAIEQLIKNIVPTLRE
jgi:hydrogenase maturation protease